MHLGHDIFAHKTMDAEPRKHNNHQIECAPLHFQKSCKFGEALSLVISVRIDTINTLLNEIVEFLALR